MAQTFKITENEPNNLRIRIEKVNVEVEISGEPPGSLRRFMWWFFFGVVFEKITR